MKWLAYILGLIYYPYSWWNSHFNRRWIEAQREQDEMIERLWQNTDVDRDGRDSE